MNDWYPGNQPLCPYEMPTRCRHTSTQAVTPGFPGCSETALDQFGEVVRIEGVAAVVNESPAARSPALLISPPPVHFPLRVENEFAAVRQGPGGQAHRVVG